MYSVITGEDVKEEREHRDEVAAGHYPANQSRAKKQELMRKGKGIGRGVLYRLRHEDYLNTIVNYSTVYQISMNSIRADKTLLFKVEQRKIAFHSLETKRYSLRGGIHTMAFGNYKIDEIEREEEEMELDMVDAPATLQQLLV
jgi:hypothetical protein